VPAGVPAPRDGRPTARERVVACGVWWSAPVHGDGAALALLDDAERARRDALRSWHDRARFVTGRALARRALAFELGTDPAAIALVTRCPTCGGPHGKPVLAEHAGIDFSISHAGDRVLVATCRGAAIGVDVEHIRAVEDLDAPEAGVLGSAERAVLLELPEQQRDAAFMRYWTRKEAVLKATGDGLVLPMAALRVTAPGEPPAVTAWPEARPARDVQMLDLRAGRRYRACLAVLTDLPVRVTERVPVPLRRRHARRSSNSSSGPPTIAVTRPDGSS
jgi:4'-phosphopantetheinyl transferase